MSEMRKCDVCGEIVRPHGNHPVGGLEWSDFDKFQELDRRFNYTIEDVCDTCYREITKRIQQLIKEKSEVKE